MVFKRGWILPVIAILIIVFSQSVLAQSTLPDCNNAGGIWCSNVNTCVVGEYTEPTTPFNICEIHSSDENQTIVSDTHIYFKFNKLDLEENTKLHFVSPRTIPFPSSIPEIGVTPTQYDGGFGSVDVLGNACDPASTSFGVYRFSKKGGDGGNTLQLGSKGERVTCSGEGLGIIEGATAQRSGGFVSIITKDITLYGEISVSGEKGNQGAPAYEEHGGLGCPGGTAGGGSGGGILILLSQNEPGGVTGKVTANGGDGGEGGLPTDDNGNLCGSGEQHGSGGGNGGGGAAGLVFLSPTLASFELEVDGGIGGFWNCGYDGKSCDPAINGYTNIEHCSCQFSPPGTPGKKGEPTTFGQETFCSDGIDNDNDLKFDMDDPDCYQNYEGQELRERFLNGVYPEWYNASAKNGLDLSCGDDACQVKPDLISGDDCLTLSSDQAACEANACKYGSVLNANLCVANTNECNNPDGSQLTQSECESRSKCTIGQDDGFILPGENYACFNSDDVWKWEYAIPPGLKIKGTAKGDYVSNGETWSVCSANGYNDYLNGNVSEYGHPQLLVTNGELACTSTLRNILGQTANIIDCEPGECPSDATLVDAYCPKVSGDDGELIKLSHTKGNFLSECGDIQTNCKIKVNGVFKILNEPNLLSLNPAWCSLVGGAIDPACGGTIINNVGSSNNNFRSSIICPDRFLGECINEEIDSSNSCAQITGDSLQRRICDLPVDEENPGEYCQNGYFVHSSNDAPTGEAVCCYGDSASCTPYDNSDAQCLELEGNVKPDYLNDDDDVECLGKALGTNCCIGSWESNVRAVSFTSNEEAIMCFEQSNENKFLECCGVNDPSCNNDGFKSVLGGVALQSLQTFDDVNEPYYKEYRLGIDNSYKLSDAFSTTNWNSFTHLDFEIAYSVNTPLTLVINSGGESASYNIQDFITNKAGDKYWQHVSIELKSQVIDLENVNSIEITSTRNIDLYLDNFYLKDNTNTNSNNYYCSGDWNVWIDDLDANEQFYGISDNDYDLFEISPYKSACNSVLSFGWTGTLCCGDDTNQNGAEHYVDKEGVCYEGSYMYNDDTLYQARGLTSELLKEKSLLYYEKKLYACDLEPSEYDAPISIDAVTTQSGNFKNSVEKSELFATRGSWTCVPNSGWVKSKELNSLAILAAEFQSLAEDDYTLFCSENVNEIINIGATGLDTEINGGCVLRMGSPSLNDAKVIVGLAGKDNFDSIQNTLLRYEQFNNEDFVLATDCSLAKNNPAANEFFTKCITEQSDIKVYYNKPFNIAMISPDAIYQDGVSNGNGVLTFIATAWNNLLNFIDDLFGKEIEKKIPFQSDKFNHLYIAQQGELGVIGSFEISNGQIVAKLDYINFENSVSHLRRYLAQTTAGEVEYFSNGYTQTIFAKLPIDKKDYWKTVSSMLRIKEVGSPTQFEGPVWNDGNVEYPEMCDILEPATPNTIYIDGKTIDDGLCSNYNSNYVSGQVICSEPGSLDLSNCATTQGLCINDDNSCPVGCTASNDNDCIVNLCANNILDGDEIAVDCGPSCSSTFDSSCFVDSDCSGSEVCDGNLDVCVCPVVDSCENGILDGDEIAIDCGPSCSNTYNTFCTDNSQCSSLEYCASNNECACNLS